MLFLESHHAIAMLAATLYVGGNAMRSLPRSDVSSSDQILACRPETIVFPLPISLIWNCTVRLCTPSRLTPSILRSLRLTGIFFMKTARYLSVPCATLSNSAWTIGFPHNAWKTVCVPIANPSPEITARNQPHELGNSPNTPRSARIDKARETSTIDAVTAMSSILPRLMREVHNPGIVNRLS